MQSKLEKILNIKIDAINKNIENLNYLNSELDKNNESMNYLKEKISLFKDNEIINFDQISKDEFERILLMIDPSITDVFRDKACSYEGIVYIIEGIRKSISLQLTKEQTNAILLFVNGMQMKLANIKEVISNLEDGKNRLPETDLNILNSTLDSYENIVSKYENNLYLTEIDEIEDALTFGEVPVEEKVDIFEYILKYNADIYKEKIESEVATETEKEEDKEFDLPTFNFEPLEINDSNKELENETNDNNDFSEEEKDIEFPTFSNLNMNYDEKEEPSYQEETELSKEIKESQIENNEEINFIPVEEDDKTKEIDIAPESSSGVLNETNSAFSPIDEVTFSNVDLNQSLPEVETNFENVIPESKETNKGYDEIESSEESRELNTVELEDIIKKIDARLKEMETSDEKPEEDNISVSIPTPIEENNELVDYTDVLEKYQLSKINITNQNKDDVNAMLEIFNEHNLLDSLKNNKIVLEKILSNCTKERMNEIISLIDENLLVKKNEFDYVFDIMLKTMPILFTDSEVLNSFKANLEFFKEKKLNIINLFDNYRELLIMNNDVLKENYNKVEQYGFEINNDNVKYYLYNRNIIENIDSYIEAVGYEKGFLGRDDRFDGIDYIKKNPYKLNEINKDTLMKLRYSSENNSKIYGNKPGILSGEISNPKVDILTLSDDYKNTYFSGEYSSIDRNEYQNIKKEISELKEYDLTIDENIKKLDDKYKHGELRYQFGNALISRIKTIRIYNFLKNKDISLKNKLLVALTYNTVLKNDEFNEIEKVVDTIIEGGN